MKRGERVSIVLMVCVFSILILSQWANATEYTWGNHEHLWEDNYNTSAGTDYGTYRTENINSSGKWELLNDSVYNINYAVDKYNETYCVGVVRYKTKAEEQTALWGGGLFRDLFEGRAYGYYATKKPDDVDCIDLDEDFSEAESPCPGFLYLHGNHWTGSISQAVMMAHYTSTEANPSFVFAIGGQAYRRHGGRG